MAGLRAGAAEVNITPPVGVELTGFGGRPTGCTGVHDEIFAKALVLDDGRTKLAIVTSDLLSMDFDLVERTRKLIYERTGIPASHAMLNSSHTHSAPAAATLRGLGARDEAYCDVLCRKIASAVQMAASQLTEAKFGAAREPVLVGINRRQVVANKGMVLGVNPQGTVAAYVDVLRVERLDGEAMAVLFSHAAHPVVLGGSNLLVTADYPGYAMAVVKQVLGGNVVAMFAQACCGNINAHPRVGGTYADAKRLGTILGAATVKAAALIQTQTTADVPLGMADETVQLPLQPPLPLDEARKQVEAAEQKIKDLFAQPNPHPHPGQLKLAQGTLEWARDMLKLSEEGDKPRTQPFEIQVFRIGDVAVVGLPGEVFVEYQLHLDQHAPFKQTLVLGHTNGCIGYVPTADAFPQGGYEVTTAYKYYGTLMRTPESDGIIRSAGLRLLKAMVDG
ncbi:MAG: hypothetical protein FJ279_26780 [Planctomycetes bacterium]|nr:hypothetical protein [Planctomycetota bacterium]